MHDADFEPPAASLAVIVAAPGLTAVTTPVWLTVATDSSEVVHFAPWFLKPAAPFTVALRVVVAPSKSSFSSASRVTDVALRSFT